MRLHLRFSGDQTAALRSCVLTAFDETAMTLGLSSSGLSVKQPNGR
jgi:hypothetical protein